MWLSLTGYANCVRIKVGNLKRTSLLFRPLRDRLSRFLKLPTRGRYRPLPLCPPRNLPNRLTAFSFFSLPVLTMSSNASRVVEILSSNVAKPELDDRSYHLVKLREINSKPFS